MTSDMIDPQDEANRALARIRAEWDCLSEEEKRNVICERAGTDWEDIYAEAVGDLPDDSP